MGYAVAEWAATIGIVVHDQMGRGLRFQSWPQRGQNALMLDIKCPNCDRQLRLPEDAIARECQCPVCEAVFAPSRRHSAKPQAKAPANQPVEVGEVPNLRLEVDDPEAESRAERRHHRDEAQDDHADEIANENRWNQSIRGAKIGFAIGCLTGIISLFALASQDVTIGGVLSAMLGGGVLAATHGFTIGFLATVPRHCRWMLPLLIAVLGFWIFGSLFVKWYYSSRTDFVGLVGAGIIAVQIGLLIVPLSWLVIAGFVTIASKFRN
jgi:hypothetical protein